MSVVPGKKIRENGKLQFYDFFSLFSERVQLAMFAYPMLVKIQITVLQVLIIYSGPCSLPFNLLLWITGKMCTTW